MADDIDPSQDPSLTPYRLESRDPNGQVKVTTGYGTRRPIQPPGQGVPVPDLTAGVRGAFQNMPVDQAIRAMDAAVQYQGQRGYMRDLQNGMTPAQAFSKWGPMLFHRNATGMSAALRAAQPAPTPKSFPQGTAFGNRFFPNRPGPQPKVITDRQTGEISSVNPATGDVKVLRPGTPPPIKKLTGADAQEEAADRAVLVDLSKQKAQATTPKAAQELDKKIGDVRSRIRARYESGIKPAKSTTPKRVRVEGPGGRKGTIPEGTALPEGWKLVEGQ